MKFRIPKDATKTEKNLLNKYRNSLNYVGNHSNEVVKILKKYK